MCAVVHENIRYTPPNSAFTAIMDCITIDCTILTSYIALAAASLCKVGQYDLVIF